tara:strand:+ start:5773 stop:6666 length:894 start_codon:yes stop_codon:yes gene_type:complete
MTFIGQQPSTTFDSGIQDRFTGLSTNTVTLTHEISAEEDILVVWNNIVQDKNSYSVGGTGNKTLTLGGTLVSADVVTVYYLNKVMQSVNPTANSVGITELNVSDGSNGQVLQTNGSGTLSFTTVSGTTINNNANNRIITGSGTANTLEGESTLTYDGTTLQPTTSGGGLKLDNLGSSDVNTLDDYEEGSWTPNWDVNGGSVTGSSSVSGKYIKIGKCVMLQAQGTLTTNSPTGYYKFTNAPFQADGNFTGTGHEFGQTGTQQIVWMDDNSTQVNIKKYDGSVIANPYLRLNIFYHTD